MRPSALTLVLTRLGDGQVVTVAPPEDLLPRATSPQDTLIEAPMCVSASNVRLFEQIARSRTGYTAFISNPSANRAQLVTVRFDNNMNEILRLEMTAAHRYLAGAWGALTFSPTIQNSSIANYWSTAMVRHAGAGLGNQLFLTNGYDADPLYTYPGGASTISSVASTYFRGPRAILGHKGRGFAMNVYDLGTNSRRFLRIWYSIVGDPTTYIGTGAGTVDLDDDPYPIVMALAIGGNVVVFKSTLDAGSIVVGTPTGSTSFPYRWDTLNTENVGLLAPRTLVGINPDTIFFVGHDGFYFYDGARGLLGVADTISRDVVTRINRAALYASWARYDSLKHEVLVGIATGSATSPTEFWRIDSRSRKVSGGPDAYAHALYSAAPYTLTGIKRWDDFAPGITWDSFGAGVTWDSLTGDLSTGGYLFSDASGAVFLDDGTSTTDAGTAITGTWISPGITPHKYVLASGRVLEHDTVLALRDIALVWRNEGTWTPIVGISIDGGATYTTVSTGTAIGPGLATNRLHIVRYTIDNPPIAGSVFQVRVQGGSAMRLMGVRTEFTYAGSGRND